MSVLRSQLIRISSKDRDIGTNEKFEIHLKNSLHERIIACKLVSCIHSNVFHNIRSGHNVFSFTEAAQSRVNITVPEGYYSSTKLFDTMKTLIDAALVAGSVALTLDDTTYKINITFTGTTAAIDVDATATISRYLGFSTSRTVGAVHTADHTPKLGGLDELFITSRRLAGINMIDAKTKTTKNTLAVIPNNVPFLGKAVWESDTNDGLIYYPAPISLRDVDIAFENSEGVLLDLQDQHIKLVIRVYY